ncbi:hypothetical protein HHE02_09900 [Helicobacter heilmannii]|nr:hypothetical protein BN341_3290 [Helicobacter heilmannii ASB1.4]CCM73362.1 hypothetical protein BN341_3660 [Helicobacter heilmannii ASB1.4]CRF45328.1 hypothetical protein HHE014_02910 [Helicobacter heilmannii]CRF47695.1 hypothetical protein HHE02_09900 [Helicobacter heilmannii]
MGGVKLLLYLAFQTDPNKQPPLLFQNSKVLSAKSLKATF